MGLPFGFSVWSNQIHGVKHARPSTGGTESHPQSLGFLVFKSIIFGRDLSGFISDRN